MVTKRKRGKRDSSGSASKSPTGRGSSNAKKKKEESKSPSAKKNDETSSTCMLYKLIQQLNKIASNKTAIINTFKALSSATFTPIATETSLEPIQDGVNVNLMLLATYILNTFLSNDFCGGDDDDTNASATGKIVEVAIAQALIASELSIILMNDKLMLERTANNGTISNSSMSPSSSNNSKPGTVRDVSDVKNILIKASLTVIMSATSSMKRLSALDRSTVPTTTSTYASASSSKKSDAGNSNIPYKIIYQAIWKNVNTLERMLVIPKRKTPPATSTSTQHIPVTNQHAHSINMHPQRVYEWSLLASALDKGGSNSSDDVNSDDKAEFEEMQAQQQEILRNVAECISPQEKHWMMPFVFGTEMAAELLSATNSPPTKRKRKSQKSSSVASGKEKFEEMLSETKAIEGRIQIRKVTSTAFVHCCAGQYHLLDVLVNMLEGMNIDASDDAEVLDSDDDHGANLWREIMSPGVVKCDGGKKTKKKKNNDIKVEIDEDTGGYMVLNVFATRIIEIVYESGKMCGSFPAKIGSEEYIQRRWDAFEDVVVVNKASGGTGSAVSTSSTRASVTRRPDITSMVIIVMRLVTLTHQHCLRGIGRIALANNSPFNCALSHLKLGDEGAVGYILLNEGEGETMPGSVLRGFAFYHPTMHKTMDTLIRCAISSSSPAEIGDGKYFFGIAAAIALRCSVVSHKVGLLGKKGKTDNSVDTVLVVDAKLCSFAVQHLLETVNSIISFTKLSLQGNENDTVGKDLTTPIIEQFLLNEPINPGRTVENASLFVSSVKADNCNFRIEESIVQSGFLFGLFFRAMLPDGKKVGKGVTSKSPQTLIQLLMNVVKCCYIDRHDTTTTKIRRQTCFTRSVLAADCLDAIRKCISCIQYKVDDDRSAKSLAAVRLRACLRKCIPSTLYHSFAGLGQVLENNLIHQRSNFFSETIESTTKPPPSILNSTSSSKLEFEQWERRAWNSHIKCCLAFVRGNADYGSRISNNTSQPKKKSCIGTCNERLQLFKAVASSSLAGTCGTKWPLYMSSTHHALVTGNLTCDPLPRTAKEASPERFICEGFIESIVYSLGDPESTILKTEKRQNNPKIQVSDEVVPLSLRDARLFAVAMCRTPKKERMNLITKLVVSLHSALGGIQSDENLRSLLVTKRAYSSFIARVITVCSNMVDMISSGTVLLESLCIYIGPLHYHLPSFIELDDKMDAAQPECVSDWYKRESCFMGLWPDWEMSSLPACHVDSFIEPLSKEDLDKYSSILKTALDLGFETARSDMCHLAFAAWNASAKLEGIEHKNWTGLTKTSEMTALSDASKLMAIRSDMCALYSELESEENIFPGDSYLSLKLRAKRKRYADTSSRTTGIELLQSGVHESIKMLENITSVIKEEDAEDRGPGMCVVAEATLTYMSFLTAMFTTTDTDLLSALVRRDNNRRKRKNSSSSGDSGDVEEDDASEDSEHSGGYNDFDEEEEDEAQMDGITRLHHVCNVLGASPFHPDWLDSACRLRPGMTENTSVELTEMMLQALTEFGVHAFARYARLLNEALSSCTKDVSGQAVDGIATLAIMRGIRSCDQKSGLSEDLNWHEDISEALNIDVTIIQALSKGLPCKNTNSVKESFTLNAAHRIKGKLQDFVAAGSGWVPGISEFRTGGEWELLLSDSIVGACSSLDIYQVTNDSKEGKNPSFSETQLADPSINTIIGDALRWKRILQNTISSMVTVNALLRFGLNGAKGRNQHQMTSFESDEILSMDRSRLSYQTSPIKQRPGDRIFHRPNLSSMRLKTSINRALSFLAEVQSCGFTSPSIQQSARSAVCHLIQKDEDPMNLEGVHVIRNAIVAMKVFSGVQGQKGKTRTKYKCMRKLIDCMTSTDLVTSNFDTKLLFCLGSPIGIKIDSIAEALIDMGSMLQNNRHDEIYGDFEQWDWTKISLQEIQLLIKIAQGQYSHIVDSSTRLKVIGHVRDLLHAEDRVFGDNKLERSIVRIAIFEEWKNLSANQFQVLFKDDICVLDSKNASEASEKANRFEISRSLCAILVRLLGITTITKADNQVFKTALKVLKAQMQYWVQEKELNHLICTICILAMRFGSIKDVGKNLMRILMSGGNNGNEGRDLTALELFYRFLRDSSRTSNGGLSYSAGQSLSAPTLGNASESSKMEVDSLPTSEKKQNTCSYVSTHGNFTEQHWYNCYTCGLTWDKGCCSLCALVCHKGHDVGYSRKSSFFCDCGAEVRTSAGRLKCRCKTELPPATLESVYCNEAPPVESLEVEKFPEPPSVSEEDICWNEAIDLSASQFASEVKNALEDFKGSVDTSVVEDLFGTFNAQFDAWVNRENMQNIIASGSDVFGYGQGRPKDLSIASRDGVSLDLSKVERQSLSLIRGTRSSALNVKLSDFSLERTRKALLVKNAVTRNVMAVDLRGRLIIAESNSLLFCAALPLVNTRHISNPLDTPLDRSQLCILGTKKSDFGAIVGIALCPNRDRRLLSWGFVSVSVHLLNERCDEIDGTIDLSVDLDDSECDSDYVVKAEWITDRVVAVVCATAVKVFDLEANCSEIGSKRYLCQPAVNFLSAYDDMMIRAGVVIPVESQNTEDEDDGRNMETYDVITKKIVLLFDTGRLHMVDLNLKQNGGLDYDGDITIEFGDGLSFPISGARRFGGTPEPAGTTSRSLGEGSCLVYLKQSRTLLYKCVSSCMIGFIINGSGNISGSFEFLPHIISSELTDQTDGGSVSGPYSNWTELGTIERGNSSFYRAAFICRSTTTNQPQPMYIEYNQDSSKVKTIRMPNNANLMSSLNSSIEGMAAFSGPIIHGNSTEDGSLGPRGSFSERVFLLSVTSSGILSFYGDQLDDKHGKKNSNAATSVLSNRRRALSDSGIASRKEIVTDRVKFKDFSSGGNPLPSFPLTIFETIINVTPANNLIFGGDGIEADGAIGTKRKLSTGSSEYVVSPSKDGCTFIVSLQRSSGAKSAMTDEKTYYDPSKHAIVAVRVLLGTNNTDFVPREISIMGRPIKPTRDKKRWYDVPLTDEEIMLGVRTGFVSICISGSQDGDRNPALIDAIEVYAKERSSLPHIFPILKEKVLRSTTEPSNIQTDVEECRQSLDTSILVISHLLQLLGGGSGLWSKISEGSLQRLIQVTALDSDTKGSVRNHVIEMLKEVETDSNAMQILLDKGTLQGICNTLKDLESILAKVQVSDSGSALIPPNICEKILAKVNSCLAATIAIVKERPGNYKHAIESFIASKTARSSIALYSKGFVMKCGDSTLATATASKLVELIIREAMSNSANDASCTVHHFAGLEAISEMLRSPDENIVKQCCISVAKVLEDLPCVLSYGCDCCNILPITKMRYTMDEYDIDLCQECYNKGISYALIKGYSTDLPVLINKKPIHIRQNNRDLTCAEICRMTSKTVPEIPKDQIPDLPNSSSIQSSNHEPMEVDEDDVQLQIALKMSLESQDESQDPSRAITLRSMIFKILLDDVVKNLSSATQSRVSNTVPIINLLLTLVLQCNRSEDRVELGQKMCKSFCQQIGDLIQPCIDPQSSRLVLRNSRCAIILYLRALICLMTKKDEISSLQTSASSTQKITDLPIPPATNKSKTDPRFVCDSHGVPAVRRRCSHGEHKDRRFYVCGMDRKLRCKYFKWADEVGDDKSPKADSGKNLDMLSPNSTVGEKATIDSMLQSVLWKHLNSGNPPFHKRMCALLRSFIKKSHTENIFNSNNGRNYSVPAISPNLRQKLLNTADRIDDDNDGVFLAAKKLGYFNSSPNSVLTDERVLKSSSNELSSVEAALDFLTLVASHSSDITQKAYASWEAWYSPLCQIISKESPSSLRSQAKKMLKCLCGGRKVIYHQIRDRFVFASQFMELLECCQYPLQAALFARQKARQCGPQWRQSDIAWATLSTGGLIGAKDLISEDNYTISAMEKISKVLDNLASITKSRYENWRHFCALDKLPQKDYDLDMNSSETKLQGSDGLNNRSPICLLLWMACSLPSKYQVKLMQLMDVALRGSRELHQPKDSIPPAASMLEESHGIITTDIGTDAESQGRVASCKDAPEDILLAGASGLTINDLCAFALHFVLNGKNSTLRIHAKNIIFRLLTKSTRECLQNFVRRMSTACMGEIAANGTQAVEFLQLLTQIVSYRSCMQGIDTSFLAKVSITCFTEQLATNYNLVDSSSNKNLLELTYRKDTMAIRDTFDLTHCVYCQDQPSKGVDTKENRAVSKKQRSTINECNKDEQECDEKPWAHEQLSSYRRISLDQQHTVSTEFSSLVQLKSRLSISEIFLQVSDQRGRFVKTIAVYFSPRPVNDMNDLKDDQNGPLWQRCGTFTLTRGANNASCKMLPDVVAACLKFEYVDFYEKITGPRTSSGAMVLHCPRCTRVVDNAHGGVCGHCGEVAFQCRKCRHINYDRLDAFLCVECGYCSSGTFSYELEAGGATSAVAILGEEDLERTLATLQTRTKKYNEVKTSLKKLISSAKETAGSKRKRDTDDLLSESLEKYSSPLKRALLGELPKIIINKGGKEKKSEAKKSLSSLPRSSVPSASNRARSLLSLARQLRGESGSDVRSSLGDLLVQQARLSSGARSGFAFDEEGDVNLMPFDMPDPLSRLVANIQARARGEAETLSNPRIGETESKRGDDNTDKTNKKEANSKLSEEAYKYLNQMRGIRKDCDELQKRIIAWKRLNQDALADQGASTNCVRYSPTTCQKCAASVTLHLLELAHAHLKFSTDASGIVVHERFIRCLFDGQITDDPKMVELKRAVLVTIAKNSDIGSKMVFEELQLRLDGARDNVSAQILGQLLKNDVKAYDKFVELAVKTLSC